MATVTKDKQTEIRAGNPVDVIFGNPKALTEVLDTTYIGEGAPVRKHPIILRAQYMEGQTYTGRRADLTLETTALGGVGNWVPVSA